MNIGEWYTYNGIPASTTSTHMAGIDIMVVSQDEISNTSLLRIRPWIMKRSGSGFWNYNSQTMTIKVDDQSKTTKTSYDFRKATTNDKEFLTSDYPFKRVSGSGSLVSGTYVYDFTINHEDDGSKTIPIYALIPLSSSYGTNWTVDENIDLPTIPRQSQFDISNWSTNATPVEQSKSLKIIEGNPNYYTQLVVRLMQEPDSYLVKRKGIQGGTYNFQFTQDELNNIVYSKIPSNSRVIGFSLETYSDSNYTQLIGKSNASPWYTATIVDANPTFNDFDYEDINSKTIALTGNSNKIVKGYSTLKVTIPVENKATGQKGATISGYNIGNYSVAYSDTTNVVKEIPNYSSENIVVSAVDSRGNSKSITKLFTDNLINYTDVVILNCEVNREDEIGEKVKIKFDGEWWPSNFGGANGGGVLNKLTAIYQYQTGNGEFVNGTTPLTLNVSEFGKFSCEQYIVGDTGNGFNISNSYKIKVIVSDKLSSKPNTKELIAGEPAIAIFGNKVALHNKYDESRENIPVQIYGNTDVQGNLTVNSKSLDAGRLLAFGVAYSGSSNSAAINKDNLIDFSNGLIPDKFFDIKNIGEEVLIAQSGTFRVKTKGIVGMVKATMYLTGLGQSGFTGFWWGGNSNELPSGVALLNYNGSNVLTTGPTSGAYGGSSNSYIYSVEENTPIDTEFFVNPVASCYGGAFIPASGGTKCTLIVEVYSK